MNLWCCYYKFDLFNTYAQTWINSQTHLARPFNEKGAALFKTSMNVFRKVVTLNLWPDAEIYKSPDFTGYAMIEGKRRRISVSGHLINLLLVSSGSHVDFVRYMDTIEDNIMRVSRDREALVRFDKYQSLGVLAEKNAVQRQKLWHTYWDYYSGVATALQLSKTLRLPFSPRVYAYVLRRLLKLRRKWPLFA